MIKILFRVILVTLNAVCEPGEIEVAWDWIGTTGGFDVLLKHLLCAIVLFEPAVCQRGEYIGLSAATRGGLPGLGGLGSFSLFGECNAQPVDLFGYFGLCRPTGAQIFGILQGL